MVKPGKKLKPLRSLPIDISALAGAPVASLHAHAKEAAAIAISVFDTSASQKYVTSGRLSAPMGTHIEISRAGVRIRHGVSSRRLSIRDLSVDPSLDTSTTGSRRRSVHVEGKRGVNVEVPRGFIWNGAIFMRGEHGRKIYPAKSWLSAHEAVPSPATMLGGAASDVISAETDALLKGLDDYAGENGK